VRNRSTTDLLILLIACTICFSIVSVAISVIVLQFVQPENKGGFVIVSDLINTLIGLLAGFLAGRTESMRRQNGTPELGDK